jgi:hypothetical protein
MISDALKSDLPLRIRYFLRISNVGDRVNPLIVNALCAKSTRFSVDVARPHLLAIGSLMASAEAASLVWGTGVMHPTMGLGNPRPENIYAIRGKLSAEVLQKEGILRRDIPLGDPGLLIHKIFDINLLNEPRYEVGLVPHYVDRTHPWVRRLLGASEVCDLNVHLDPLAFLKAMSKCRVIVSSSLHGLIFAEAMGLPSLWFKASGEIAGEDFKFHDWFSTTRNPQRFPINLSGSEKVELLSGLAERRNSSVSTEDLVQAFPKDRISELQDSIPAKVAIRCGSTSSHLIPVFIISFNRGHLLLRCLKGLNHLSRPTLPIIHDNGSTDPDTLQILSDLEASGVRVYRRPAITSADELSGVDSTIADFFANWCEPSRYIVTDCDIDMSVAESNVLDIYDELLNMFRKVECVGPMLRIRDIKQSYPLFSWVMNRHIEQFWSKQPSWGDTSHGKVAFQECLIDTTFALHRAGETFRRLKTALRVYEPYEALHLDWYEETRELDKAYPITSHSDISHWNNQVEENLKKHETLRFQNFRAVCLAPDGTYQECICKLPLQSEAF